MSPRATAPQNHRCEAGRHRLAAPARAEVFKPEKLKWTLRFSEGHWFPWATLGLVRQTDRRSSSPPTHSLGRAKPKVCRWNMEKGCLLETHQGNQPGSLPASRFRNISTGHPKGFLSRGGHPWEAGQKRVSCPLLPRGDPAGSPQGTTRSLPCSHAPDTALPGPCPSLVATGGCAQQPSGHPTHGCLCAKKHTCSLICRWIAATVY